LPRPCLGIGIRSRNGSGKWIPDFAGMGGRTFQLLLKVFRRNTQGSKPAPTFVHELPKGLQYLIRNIIISALLIIFGIKLNKAEKYIEKVRQWACTKDRVAALALVGSHARQQVRPDSDIDFVIISDDVAMLEKDISWLNRFGTVQRQAKEKWGSVTAIRVFYDDGQEIEFGLALKNWAAIPADAGTKRVVKDGIVILKDPDNILEKLKAVVLKDNNKELPKIDINLVSPAEIDSVMVLVKAAIEKMHRNGIPQWGEYYPTREIFLADIADGSLYAARINGSIVGIIGLDENQFSEWQKQDWIDTKGKPLAVHRLCVATAYQGQGVAKIMMGFSEDYAGKKGCTSIRLDAFAGNPISLELYDSLGYRRCGIFTGHAGNCYCFEKLLRGDGD
jgi:ribosomal protein S18 acetylase RimI-like enzyme